MSGDYTTIKLGDLFDDKQSEEVTRLMNAIKAGDAKPVVLREYLESLSEQLEAKGILPAYLYYWLCYQFQLPL